MKKDRLAASLGCQPVVELKAASASFIVPLLSIQVIELLAEQFIIQERTAP